MTIEKVPLPPTATVAVNFWHREFERTFADGVQTLDYTDESEDCWLFSNVVFIWLVCIQLKGKLYHFNT
jgi:hypothetical protein